MRKCVPLALVVGLTSGCETFVEGETNTFSTSNVSDSDIGSTTPGNDEDDTSQSGPDTESETGGDPTGTPDVVCGNGLVEPGELCDEGDDNGFGSCKEDCQPNWCGDGYIGPGELCDDGNMIAGDECTDCTTPNCGNGNVELPEQCDDGNGNQDDDCLNTCVYASCGDQVIHAMNELCDREDVAGVTCMQAGEYSGGTLLCNDSCDGYIFDLCFACGDSSVNPGEECDSSDLNGHGCGDVGETMGTVSCNTSCTVDYSQCSTCSDGEISGAEECDGAMLGGQTCQGLGLGYDDGTLACDAGCHFNDDACSDCGDAVVESPPEDCDGNTRTCAMHLGGMNWTGSVTCNTSCDWVVNCCKNLDAACSAGQTCCGGGVCMAGTCCLPNGSTCETGAGDRCCGSCNGGTMMCG